MAAKMRPVPTVVGEGQDSSTPGDVDIQIECAIDRPPLVPDGNYQVIFVRVDKQNLWGRTKLFLHFQIVEPGEHQGKALFMAVNFPQNGKFPISSKFLQQWAIAAGYHPSRRDRMSTKAFRGKVFLGAVRTVKQFVHSSRKMKDRDPSTFYSVVDHLIEVLTGR